jgi:hypothetical protein
MRKMINKSLLIAIGLLLFCGSAECLDTKTLNPFSLPTEKAPSLVPPPPARPAIPARHKEGKTTHNSKKNPETDKENSARLPVTQGEGEGPGSAEKFTEMINKNSAATQTQVVYDDDYQAVRISLKDVTRLVCFTDINKTVYSKEKNMEIETEGRDAFIKNLAVKSADQLTGQTTVRYDTRPKELYVMCGAKTFSIILVPDDIPATTIWLKSRYADKTKAAGFEASDYQNTFFKLIKAGYNEDIPDGYDVEDIDKPQAKFKEGTLVHRRNYTGDMFQLVELIFIANEDVNLDELQILETLKFKNTLAVSIVDETLAPHQQTRIFLVRANHE